MMKLNADIMAQRRQQRLYTAVLLLTLVWCILIFMPPFLARIGGSRFSFFIRLFFAPICHQMENRSFSLGDVTLAVCARCTGIYLGFLAGVLTMPLIRRIFHGLDYRKLLLGGFALMGLEFLLTHSVLPSVGLWRAVSGAWIGGLTGLLALISLFELQCKRYSK